MRPLIGTSQVHSRLSLLLPGQTVTIRFALTEAMVLELLQQVFRATEPSVLFYVAVAEQLAAIGTLPLWQEILQHPNDYRLRSISVEQQADQKYVILRYERETAQSA